MGYFVLCSFHKNWVVGSYVSFLDRILVHNANRRWFHSCLYIGICAKEQKNVFGFLCGMPRTFFVGTFLSGSKSIRSRG